MPRGGSRDGTGGGHKTPLDNGFPTIIVSNMTLFSFLPRFLGEGALLLKILYYPTLLVFVV